MRNNAQLVARSSRLFCSIGQLACLFGLLACVANQAGAQLIYREQFNDDGHGTRYQVVDGGYEITDAGPAIWGHNFEADVIGLGSNAPARRASILWGPLVLEDQIAPEALEVWGSLVSWAVGGKANARIGFFPGKDLTEGDFIVSDYLENLGYTVDDIFDTISLPPASQLDLLIHTSSGTPIPSDALVNYGVPVISYNRDWHDDNAIAGIGPVLDFFEEVAITTVAENQTHPALGGKTGNIPWTTEALQMGGIGKAHSGGQVLATVEDPLSGDQIPALFIIEQGQPLLGAFAPEAEGGGYIVGAALDKFGSLTARTLDINPVDLTGKSDVKMTVALAGSDADFEDADYLRIYIDPNNSGTFNMIANFTGNLDKALQDVDPSTPVNNVVLGPTEFTDVTFDIPAGATNLVIRFEVFNTWGNEIAAIDDLRIYSGNITAPGDFNGNGTLDVGDIDDLTAQSAAGTNPGEYDLNGDALVNVADVSVWVRDLFNSWIGDANLDGLFNSSDLVVVLASGAYETNVASVWSTGDFNGDGRTNSSDLVAALADGGYEMGPRAAVAAVPEPLSGTAMVIGAGLLALGWRRRRH